MAPSPRVGRSRVPRAALVVSALCVVGALSRAVLGQSGEWYTPPANDFPNAGGNYTNQRYSALDQVNASNINRLGGAWSIHLEESGAAGNLDGAPIVVNGVMYVSTARLHVLAIDAATGEIKW